jgi:two-component system, response regulator PdtaR
MTKPPAIDPTHVVVVVEDEELIRQVVCMALVDEGFEVVEAEDADDALRVLHNRANEIHAVFTDVHMPGSMNGLALAHFVLAAWPWIALLISSGLAHPLSEEMPKGSRFLPKPYRPQHAVRHLREMIVSCSE